MRFQLTVLLLLSVATGVVFSSVCLKTPILGTWVHGENGYFPPGGVLGGFQGVDKEDLYICRVGDIVGKYYNPNKLCYIQENNGKIQSYPHYDILTDVGHTVWVPVDKKQMPCNLLQTGGNSHSPTYAGRVEVEPGYLIPGNVIEGVVHIPWTNVSKFETFEALSAVPKTLNLPVFKRSFVFGTTVKYLTFKVKSKDEVYANMGVNNEIKYRLTIGAFNNKVTAVGPVSSPVKVYEKSENILEGETLRGFWMRWISANTLEFGVEGVLKPIITFSDSNLHLVNSVVFESASKDSTWQIANMPEWDNFKFVERM